MDTTARVLVIGDCRRPEWEGLAEAFAFAGVATAANLAAGKDLLAAGLPELELLVLVENTPGEFSESEILTLRRRVPLAGALLAVGSWCEGEPRSGRPPSGVWRLAWHDAARRGASQVERRLAGGFPEWGWPATYGEDERLLAACANRRAAGPLDGRECCVVSDNRDLTNLLLAALGASGGSAASRRSGDDPATIPRGAALVWDVGGAAEVECPRLREWVEAVGPPVCIGLCGFLRWQDRIALLAAGATTILGKPFDLDDLVGVLRAGVDSAPR